MTRESFVHTGVCGKSHPEAEFAVLPCPLKSDYINLAKIRIVGGDCLGEAVFAEIAKVQFILDQISPYLTPHGGFARIAECDESGVLIVLLSMGENRCLSDWMITRLGIQRRLVLEVPGLTAVHIQPADRDPVS